MLSVASRITTRVFRRFSSDPKDYAKYFQECDLRVGNIIEAEEVMESNKLMVE